MVTSFKAQAKESKLPLITSNLQLLKMNSRHALRVRLLPCTYEYRSTYVKFFVRIVCREIIFVLQRSVTLMKYGNE